MIVLSLIQYDYNTSSIFIYKTETFETPTIFHVSIIYKTKLLKINKTLNTVIMSNPISISPQNKPNNPQLLNNTRYKRKCHTLLSQLCLSFKRKLSLTNTARPIPFSLFLYLSTLLLPQNPNANQI